MALDARLQESIEFFCVQKSENYKQFSSLVSYDEAKSNIPDKPYDIKD